MANLSGSVSKEPLQFVANVTRAPDLSLVLACYCEEPHLFKNVIEICEYLEASRFTFELIFVEDTSPDNTAVEVHRCFEELKRRNISSKVLFHSQNCGRGRSVQDGFEISSGEFVGFIDVDLEHPVDALLPMLIELKKGRTDAVVARRIYHGMATPTRMVLSVAYKTLVHLFIKLPVSDSEAGCKMFRREKLMPVLSHVKDPGWFWDTEIVDQCARHGLRFSEHPIVFEKKPEKKSTVRVFRDSVTYFVRLIRYWKLHRRLEK